MNHTRSASQGKSRHVAKSSVRFLAATGNRVLPATGFPYACSRVASSCTICCVGLDPAQQLLNGLDEIREAIAAHDEVDEHSSWLQLLQQQGQAIAVHMDDLRRENDDTTMALRSAQQQRDAALQELESTRRALADAHAMIEAQCSDEDGAGKRGIAALQQQLAEQTATLLRLRSDLAARHDTNTEDDSVAALTTMAVEAEREMQQTRDMLQAQAVAAADDGVNDDDDDVTGLSAEEQLREAEQTVTALQWQLKTQSQELVSVQRQCSQLQSRLQQAAALEEQLEKKDAALAEAMSRIVDLEHQLAATSSHDDAASSSSSSSSPTSSASTSASTSSSSAVTSSAAAQPHDDAHASKSAELRALRKQAAKEAEAAAHLLELAEKLAHAVLRSMQEDSQDGPAHVELRSLLHSRAEKTDKGSDAVTTAQQTQASISGSANDNVDKDSDNELMSLRQEVQQLRALLRTRDAATTTSSGSVAASTSARHAMESEGHDDDEQHDSAAHASDDVSDDEHEYDDDDDYGEEGDEEDEQYEREIAWKQDRVAALARAQATAARAAAEVDGLRTQVATLKQRLFEMEAAQRAERARNIHFTADKHMRTLMQQVDALEKENSALKAVAAQHRQTLRRSRSFVSKYLSPTTASNGSGAPLPTAAALRASLKELAEQQQQLAAQATAFPDSPTAADYAVAPSQPTTAHNESRLRHQVAERDGVVMTVSSHAHQDASVAS